MVIGKAAKASGVNAKVLRSYESIGCYPGAARTGSDYRLRGPKEVKTLRFIRQTRDLSLPKGRNKLLTRT